MTDSQSPDRRWLYSAVLARSLATGMMGVLLGIYLASLDAECECHRVGHRPGARGRRLQHAAGHLFLGSISVAGGRC